MEIFRTASAHNFRVVVDNRSRERTDCAIADNAMIHLDDWRDLRACATEEDLVGNIEFRAVDGAFAGRAAVFAERDLHDGVAGDAQEDIVC